MQRWYAYTWDGWRIASGPLNIHELRYALVRAGYDLDHVWLTPEKVK